MRTIVASILLFSAAALAQVPAEVSYQGRLLNSNGLPESGAIKIKFELFDAETNGTSKWSETQTVALTDGYYAVVLGAAPGNPVDRAVFDGATRFLEITAGTEKLAPRQRIGSVPYALVCTDSVNVVGGSVSATSLTVGGKRVVDDSGKLDYVQMKGCANTGDQLSWNGTTWACGTGSTLSTVAVATPLSGNGTSGAPLSMSVANGSQSGYLSSADWSAFNGKMQKAAVKAPITGDGTAGAPLGLAAATAGSDGYLASADFKTFAGRADPTVAGRLLEAEELAAFNVGTGVNQSDSTASGGKARFAAGSASTGGRMWGLHASELGAPFGIGYTRATFRIKVTNNQTSSSLARIWCGAVRAGTTSWPTLGSRTVRPSDFGAGQAWAYVTIYCDFRPDDINQFIGVDDFTPGITDLSLDYVLLDQTPPCNVEMLAYGDVRCIDRVARTESVYGSSVATCGQEGKHLCNYSEVTQAMSAGILNGETSTGTGLRVADLMFYPPNNSAYLGGGGGANALTAPGGTPWTSSQPARMPVPCDSTAAASLT